MHRSRALALPLIILASAALTLTGCSSDSDSGKDTASGGAGKGADGSATSAPADAGKDAEPGGSGKGSAHLTYSGGESGEISIKSVACAVIKGKLSTVNAPDSTVSDEPPSFNAIISDGDMTAALVTKDNKSYMRAAVASGITNRKSGDTWIVTVTGVQMMAADLKGEPIVLNGTLTCGSVAEI